MPLILTSRSRRALVLAQAVHAGQDDRYGLPMIAHVRAVAQSVPEEVRCVAIVHDVCERSRLSPKDVAEQVELDDDERRALELLTKQPGESLLEHTARVLAEPPGRPRRLALHVKRADIADHGRRGSPPDPVYFTAAALLED